jgi:hypothetical protein
MLLQGRCTGPESLSRELFRPPCGWPANLDLVDPGRDELRSGAGSGPRRSAASRSGSPSSTSSTPPARRQSVGVEP